MLGLGVALNRAQQPAAVAQFFAVISDHTTQYADSDLRGPAGAVVVVDWGDNSRNTYTLQGPSTDVTISHNYSANGDYTIRMSGAVDMIISMTPHTSNYDNQLGPELPGGMLQMRSLTQFKFYYGRGDLTPVINVLPLTSILFARGVEAYPGGVKYVQCNIEDVNWAGVTEFGCSASHAYYFTGNMSVLKGTTELVNVFLGNSGVSGVISGLSGNTGLVKLHLQYNTATLSGDLAHLLVIGSLQQVNLLSSKIAECSAGADIEAAPGLALNLTGSTLFSAESAAHLLKNMLESVTVWDGAAVTLVGCNGGSCTKGNVDWAGWDAGYYANSSGWLDNEVTHETGISVVVNEE